MNAYAVIVTFNRLSLLKEAVAAVRAQERIPDKIIVVNNSSTDGTGDWLATQSDLTVITQPNRGGAWGFHEGMKQAYNLGADWVWLMDDDTIPEPGALNALLRAANLTANAGDAFGFFGSKVIWNDGSLHLMNKQLPLKNFQQAKDKAYYAKHHIIPVEYNSFVSMIIPANVIEEVGLPIKEFFIWNDDIEYAKRIISQGYHGALVNDSVVLHKTPSNYASDLFADGPGHIWKYRHGLRNELFTRRRYKNVASYRRHLLKRFFLWPFKIMFRRKDSRWQYIRAVWSSSLEAMRFRPEIEHVERRSSGK